MLLHGFQKGALDFCRGTVYFIGQYEVCENGALVNLKTLVFLGVDEGADYVCGQEVRGKLDAVELGVYCL